MVVPESDITIPFPLEVVGQSSGFSLDVGGSVAKLVYRSKEEYNAGTPIDKSQTQTGIGQLHLAMFARERMTDMIIYLKEKCDIVRRGNCNTVHCCGIGGNEFISLMDDEFGLKLIIQNEIRVMIEGTCFMLKHYPDACYPKSEEGSKETSALVELALNRYKLEGGDRDQYYEGAGNTSPVERKNVQFPMMIAMVGSSIGYFKVINDEGHYKCLDSTLCGGRLYLCLASIITKLTDYQSIHELALKSNGSTVDTQFKDIITDTQKYDPGVLDMIQKFVVDPSFSCKAMTKLISAQKEDVKIGDLVHSLLEKMCEMTAMGAYYAARAAGLKTIYFVGNFVNPPIAKKWITRYIALRNAVMAKEEAISIDFIQHGGHMGALGAFLTSYTESTQ